MKKCGIVNSDREPSALPLVDRVDFVRPHTMLSPPRSGSPTRNRSPRKIRKTFSRKETNPSSSQLLFVHVIGGKNLVARDDTGFSDPYVVLVINQQKHKSKIVPQTLFPRWNEIFEFNLPNPEEECLSVTVMDWDRMARDDFMGQFVLSLKDLVTNEDRPPVWYDLQSRPGKPEAITGAIQLKIEYLDDPIAIEKLKKRKREIFLEGPVSLRRGPKSEEKLWMVFFQTAEIAFIELSDDFAADLKAKALSSRGSLTKRSASKLSLLTSPLEDVHISLSSRSAHEKLPSPRVTPQLTVKEELELVEITSISFQSENVLSVGTTRKQNVTYYLCFADEEEAMEWVVAAHCLRADLFDGALVSNFMQRQYLSRFHGGCVKSCYNEEWHVTEDGGLRCVEGEVEGLKAKWTGETIDFEEKTSKYGFGAWNGTDMSWCVPFHPEPIVEYSWNRLENEYVGGKRGEKVERAKSLLKGDGESVWPVWMWTRHFLANKGGVGEWIVEGSVPEHLVMFLQMFRYAREKLAKSA